MKSISDTWKVRRNIQISQFKDSHQRSLIQQELAKQVGVKKVDIDSHTDKSKIWITYDASQINYCDIIDVLIKRDIFPVNNWWNRFKASWYQFTDNNARDNANAPPAPCCNKSPGMTH
ncbi:MAG: hypothetical protein QM479_17400 [Pseudomonadota bacterium]